MNAKLEELLHDGMTRFTAELHAPADLTSRARRSRSRRLARRAAAGGTAVIGAAAIAVATITAGSAGGGRDGATAITAAYVTSRVRQAVTVAERRDVERSQMTTSGTLAGRTLGIHVVTWRYRGELRLAYSSATGQLLGELGSAQTRERNGLRAFATTAVSYPTRTWGRRLVSGAPVLLGVRGCKQVTVLFPPTFMTGLQAWVSALRRLVSCGDFRLAGRQRVHGVDALELVKSGSTGPAEAIWVDAATYLPLRVTLSTSSIQTRVDISWLRPTAANLEQLHPTIPAGFRRASFGAVMLAIDRSLLRRSPRR
jgi:hypothetical protein